MPHSAKAASKTSVSVSVLNWWPLDFELFTQLAVVVDFAVERDCVAPIGREHGLVSGGTSVDDGKASVAETGFLSGGGGIGSPNSIIVAATVLDRLSMAETRCSGSA